jgi:hypothetical protein
MICRLLTHGRIKTDLDEGRIKGLGSVNNKPAVTVFYEGVASKISLPLIHLYCTTKFADGEYKGE